MAAKLAPAADFNQMRPSSRLVGRLTGPSGGRRRDEPLERPSGRLAGVSCQDGASEGHKRKLCDSKQRPSISPTIASRSDRSLQNRPEADKAPGP